LVEAKEEVAVVMGAGDGFGDGGQGAVDVAVEGEAVFQDLDLQDLALVGRVRMVPGGGRRRLAEPRPSAG